MWCIQAISLRLPSKKTFCFLKPPNKSYELLMVALELLLIDQENYSIAPSWDRTHHFSTTKWVGEYVFALLFHDLLNHESKHKMKSDWCNFDQSFHSSSTNFSPSHASPKMWKATYTREWKFYKVSNVWMSNNIPRFSLLFLIPLNCVSLISWMGSKVERSHSSCGFPSLGMLRFWIEPIVPHIHHSTYC